MTTAYFLHIKRDCEMKISKHLNVSLGFSSISVLLAIIIGIFPFHLRANATTKLANSFFIAASQVGWSISLSWIVIACHCGTGGFVNSFLSLQLWRPLSRIGLSIYVTHFLAIMAIFGTQKQPTYFNEFLKTHLFFGDVGLSFGVAVLAFLTFEASFLTIEKSLNTRKDKKENSS